MTLTSWCVIFELELMKENISTKQLFRHIMSYTICTTNKGHSEFNDYKANHGFIINVTRHLRETVQI